MNVGPQPISAGRTPRRGHLLTDQTLELVGETIELSFMRRLRPVEKFVSIEIQGADTRDVERVRRDGLRSASVGSTCEGPEPAQEADRPSALSGVPRCRPILTMPSSSILSPPAQTGNLVLSGSRQHCGSSFVSCGWCLCSQSSCGSVRVRFRGADRQASEGLQAHERSGSCGQGTCARLKEFVWRFWRPTSTTRL